MKIPDSLFFIQKPEGLQKILLRRISLGHALSDEEVNKDSDSDWDDEQIIECKIEDKPEHTSIESQDLAKVEKESDQLR